MSDDEILHHGDQPPTRDAKSAASGKKGSWALILSTIVSILLMVGVISFFNGFGCRVFKDLNRKVKGPRLSYVGVGLNGKDVGYSVAYDIDEKEYLLLCFNPNNGKILWNSPIGEDYNLVQVVPGPAGVYVCDKEGLLSLYDRDNGKQKWQTDLAAITYNAQHMVPWDRGLVFLGNDDVLRSINQNGKVMWVRPMDKWRDFVVLGDIVVIDDDGQGMAGLNIRTGQLLWKIPGHVTAMSGDSKALFAVCQGETWRQMKLLKVNDQGKILWNRELSSANSLFSPVDSMICGQRWLYLFGDDSVSVILKSTGQIKAVINMTDWSPLQIAESGNRVCFIVRKRKGVDKLRLQCFEPRGSSPSPKWAASLPGREANLISANGVVCVAFEQTHDTVGLRAFDVKTGKRAWERQIYCFVLPELFCQKDKIILCSTDQCSAIDPKTGKLLWNNLK